MLEKPTQTHVVCFNDNSLTKTRSTIDLNKEALEVRLYELFLEVTIGVLAAHFACQERV